MPPPPDLPAILASQYHAALAMLRECIERCPDDLWYDETPTNAYWQHCDDMVDPAVGSLDLGSPECGFSWYAVPKLEHQIVNLRHIQNHAAQLGDRLRAATGEGIRWVGARRS